MFNGTVFHVIVFQIDTIFDKFCNAVWTPISNVSVLLFFWSHLSWLDVAMLFFDMHMAVVILLNDKKSFHKRRISDLRNSQTCPSVLHDLISLEIFWGVTMVSPKQFNRLIWSKGELLVLFPTDQRPVKSSIYDVNVFVSWGGFRNSDVIWIFREVDYPTKKCVVDEQFQESRGATDRPKGHGHEIDPNRQWQLD